MINTNLTRKAMKIAYDAHHGQVDKANVPYIYHPIHLAEAMDDEISCCVALLHDVVEDTNISFEYLADIFNNDIIEALKLLTHNKEDNYQEYIKKIKDNNIAKKVKIADLKHNLDITRLENITEADLKRREKYINALDYLSK